MKKFFILFLSIMPFFSFFILSNNEKVFSYNLAQKNEIILTHNSKKYALSLKNQHTNSKIHTIIWQASKFSRNASNENKAKTISNFYSATGNIENSFEMVFPGIKLQIEKLESKINTGCKNAYLKLGENFQIVKEKNGYELDKEKLYFTLLENLKGGNKIEIEIPTKKISPQFTEDDLKKSTNLRGSFSTDYSKSSDERKNNVQKAISSFNGLNIYPGQTVSFNKVTGKRNAKNGYQEAKIIVGGEYVQGFGGGVCQASTTIYNACLKAGLDCTARCHSIPPSYVEKGLDAMVSTGSSDMTITNNLAYPVFIQAYCTNERIYCNVFGEEMNGYSYKTKVVVNETMPDKGYKKIVDTKKEFADKVFYKDESFIKQKATQGFKTTTYLLTYKDGKLLSQNKIRSDFYPPSEGVIVFGCEERPVPEISFFDEVII